MTVLDLPTQGTLTSRPYQITTVRHQTHDIVTIDVAPQQHPIAFRPGQFDMVYVYGIGEAAISISSDPATPGLLSHTIRAVGWVTRALNDLQPGTRSGSAAPTAGRGRSRRRRARTWSSSPVGSGSLPSVRRSWRRCATANATAGSCC
jgi:hypothetical protein